MGYSLELLFRKVVQQNDYRAFEEIFKGSYPWLMRYAQSLAPCREEAENAVSEVFYKIWKNRAKIHIHRSVKSYLYQAVRNQILDTIRQSKSIPILSEGAIVPIGEYAPSPEEEMIINELEDQIQRAIAFLPEQRRRIFLLSREEGLKYSEIAQQLNISIKTVETQMSRSLKSLRKLLPTYA